MNIEEIFYDQDYLEELTEDERINCFRSIDYDVADYDQVDKFLYLLSDCEAIRFKKLAEVDGGVIFEITDPDDLCYYGAQAIKSDDDANGESYYAYLSEDYAPEWVAELLKQWKEDYRNGDVGWADTGLKFLGYKASEIK